MTKKGMRRTELDAIGIDEVCEMFESGQMVREIARELGMNHSILLKWLAADENRSARARESRAAGAAAWDEQAFEVLSGIPDDATQGQIVRAREQASHLRWRASKLGRVEYGERISQEFMGKDGGPLKVEMLTVDGGKIIEAALARCLGFKPDTE